MLDGKRLWGPLSATAAEAHDWARRARERRAGLPRHLLTLGQAMDAVDEAVARSCAPATATWYSTQWAAILLHWQECELLASITRAQVQAFVARRLEHGVCASTIQHHRRALRRLFAIARRHGHVGPSPLDGIDWPKTEDPRVEWLEADELRAILDRLRRERPDDADVVLLIALSGLRRSEVARVRAVDVDAVARVLWVTGKRRREPLPIHPDLLPVIARLLERSGGTCLVPGGAEAVKRVLRRCAKHIGDPRLRAHVLRHSFATMLIRAGERPDIVQSLMRHRSYAMTLRYFHALGSELHAATARVRLLPVPPAADKA